MLPEEIKKKRGELANDYSVNNGWAREECGYDRDRRHVEYGFDKAWSLAMEMVGPVLDFYGDPLSKTHCNTDYEKRARELKKRLGL